MGNKVLIIIFVLFLIVGLGALAYTLYEMIKKLKDPKVYKYCTIDEMEKDKDDLCLGLKGTTPASPPIISKGYSIVRIKEVKDAK